MANQGRTMKKEELTPEELELFDNHETRPDLAGEHLKGDFYQLLAMVAFLLVTLVDYFLLRVPQSFQSFISIWLRIPMAVMIVSVGGWLALYGISMVFGEYRREPVFITEGILDMSATRSTWVRSWFTWGFWF